MPQIAVRDKSTGLSSGRELTTLIALEEVQTISLSAFTAAEELT